MIAYVLTDSDGKIRDRDMLDLYNGYTELAFQTKFVSEHDFEFINITKEDVFCGHVQHCHDMMRKLDVPIPFVSDYPLELKNYFGRMINTMTCKRFKFILEQNENFGSTYFVKPLTNKLFTGFTCVTLQEFESKTQCGNNTNLYVCSYVSFSAEFRAYVYKGKVIDCFRYAGSDWKVQTPTYAIEQMCNLLPKEKFPIFYSIDVGIDDLTGKTLLVELNDGYALGNYGLAPKDYATYSAARWKEIANDSLR